MLAKDKVTHCVSFKVIGNSDIRQTTCDFLLVLYCNGFKLFNVAAVPSKRFHAVSVSVYVCCRC